MVHYTLKIGEHGNDDVCTCHCVFMEADMISDYWDPDTGLLCMFDPNVDGGADAAKRKFGEFLTFTAITFAKAFTNESGCERVFKTVKEHAKSRPFDESIDGTGNLERRVKIDNNTDAPGTAEPFISFSANAWARGHPKLHRQPLPIKAHNQGDMPSLLRNALKQSSSDNMPESVLHQLMLDETKTKKDMIAVSKSFEDHLKSEACTYDFENDVKIRAAAGIPDEPEQSDRCHAESASEENNAASENMEEKKSIEEKNSTEGNDRTEIDAEEPDEDDENYVFNHFTKDLMIRNYEQVTHRRSGRTVHVTGMYLGYRMSSQRTTKFKEVQMAMQKQGSTND